MKPRCYATTMFKILLEYGTDASVSDTSGKIAIMLAKEVGHTKIVDVLRRYSSQK